MSYKLIRSVASLADILSYGRVVQSSDLPLLDSPLSRRSFWLTPKATDPGKGMSVSQPLVAHGYVLLIEDDEAVRDMLASALRLRGFHVRTASDGLVGLRLLEAFAPEVIVLDLGLPNASGFEVLHELRATAGTRDTPVIAISGHDRGVQLARENPDFFATISKPFDPEALVHAISRALRP